MPAIKSKSTTCIKSVQTPLLRWYRRHKRDLPWRRSRDPYAIWLSEIMLQQTQVVTAIGYYERFLEQFPTVGTLAQASIEKVMKAWEGLGYYSRARHLHEAARRVMEMHGGRIPDTVDELLGLPGIGRYTAGAIASIAYGKDEPVLDGNVQRVLARVFRVRTNIKETQTLRRLWFLARQLIPAGKAGDFNQALMDLGAMVCIPRNPRCEQCPLKDLCQAQLRGEQDRIPVKAPRAALPHYDIGVGVIEKGKKILIDQRMPRGLLGGLWEFPGGKKEPDESLEACVTREVREEIGVEVEVGEKIAAVDHAFSHFRITLHAFRCRLIAGRPRAIGCTAVRWVRLDELDQYPFPKANHKVFAILRQKT